MNLIVIDKAVDEKDISDRIRVLVENNVRVDTAIRYVLSKLDIMFDTFYTSAQIRDISYCVKKSEGRMDLIRNHDRIKIKHDLDWLKYHLNRAGFLIEESSVRKTYLHFVVLKKMNIKN
jgi:hypothetical protein